LQPSDGTLNKVRPTMRNGDAWCYRLRRRGRGDEPGKV